MRIVTDLAAIRRVAPSGTEVRCLSLGNGPGAWLKVLRASLGADYLIIRFSLREVLFFCAGLALVPWCRCKIVTIDLFVESVANGPALMRALVSRVLRRVNRFLVFFRDTSAFETQLHLARAKFGYIPYKVNGYERVLVTEPTDEGYIFCGGRSRRDFATFFAAVEQLGYPVKVITSPEPELKQHGSSVSRLEVPDNVTVIQDQPSLEFFIETVSRARLVVVPIVKGTLTQTGIGVYLIAMALRKCVIVSSGLGVSDVLSGHEAIVVPAGDVDALRNAIADAWNNEALRLSVAAAGYRYAIPLGGEEELARSILAALP